MTYRSVLPDTSEPEHEGIVGHDGSNHAVIGADEGSCGQEFKGLQKRHPRTSRIRRDCAPTSAGMEASSRACLPRERRAGATLRASWRHSVSSCPPLSPVYLTTPHPTGPS